MRCVKVESNLKTFGDIQVTDGYLTVIVWMDEGNIHISLNGTKLGNWGPAGSMTLGNYITAYNGWGHEARFYSMEERVYEELDSTNLEAKRYIEQTDLPLSEIALMCGFNSPTHFNLTFKKTTGITPTLYRQKACAKE